MNNAAMNMGIKISLQDPDFNASEFFYIIDFSKLLLSSVCFFVFWFFLLCIGYLSIGVFLAVFVITDFSALVC